MEIKLSSDEKEEAAIDDFSNAIRLRYRWKYRTFGEKTQALDGIIEVRNPKGKPTGDQINVQIKTGKSYICKIDEQSNIILDLKHKKQIAKWKEVWKKVPGAMLLVFVYYSDNDFINPIIYWADLKSENSFIEDCPTKILIRNDQILDQSFLKKFKKITSFNSSYSYTSRLPIIEMKQNSINVLTLNSSQSLKKNALKYYSEWAKEKTELRTIPTLGEVIINRVGWKNICRNSRTKERIIQSWQLMPVAKKIIRKIKKATLIRNNFKIRNNFERNTITIKRYYYLRALVKFNFRSETVVYIILRHITEESCIDRSILNSRVWLYNIYEGERGSKKIKKATNLSLKRN